LKDGTHCAKAEATGVWIDIMLRKSTNPPEDILISLNDFKSENTKLLTREDLRALPFRPEDVDPSVFS
jgi:acyl-CoA thioester hydrolase